MTKRVAAMRPVFVWLIDREAAARGVVERRVRPVLVPSAWARQVRPVRRWRHCAGCRSTMPACLPFFPSSRRSVVPTVWHTRPAADTAQARSRHRSRAAARGNRRMPAPSAWCGAHRETRYWKRIPAADLAGVRYREGADDVLTLSKRSAAGRPPTMPSRPRSTASTSTRWQSTRRLLAGTVPVRGMWTGRVSRHADRRATSCRRCDGTMSP